MKISASSRHASTAIALCSFLAFFLPLLLFLPTLRHDFIALDDDAYVQHNALVSEGFSPSNVCTAFRPSSPAPMYIPVVWLSYMLDISLFGLSPAVVHFANTFWHALSSFLLFLLLLRLPCFLSRSEAKVSPSVAWPALLLTLLWSIHPLRIESVAWAAERKDVLAAFFTLLSCHAWLSALRAPTATARRLGVGATLLAFAFGLLSKPSLVPLPLLLLVLALPPCSPRIPWLRLLLVLAPFFALSLACAWITSHAHAMLNAWMPPPLLARLATIPSVLFFYAAKTLFPRHLALVYPVWTTPPAIGILLAIPFLIAGVIVFRLRRASPLLWLGSMFAVLFFIPVTGIVPVPFNLVADRFSHLPAIGLSIALLPLFLLRAPCPRLRLSLLAMVVLALSAAFVRHLPVWRVTSSVYAPIRRLLPDHHAVRAFDAWQCRLRGDFPSARECIRRAMDSGADDYSLFLSDVAAVNASDGPAPALSLLLSNPPPVPGFRALWFFFVSADQLALGDYPAVIRTASDALASVPPSDKRLRPVLRAAMAAAFHSGDAPAALRWARLSGDLPPDRSEVLLPDLFPYYAYLFTSDLSSLALPYFRRLAFEFPRPDLLNNLAWILSTPLWSPALPEEPVALARAAIAATPPDHPALPALLDTLSVALANADDFPAAIEAVSRAITLLPPESPSLPAMQSRLALYRQSIPYRERLGCPIPPSEYPFDPHLRPVSSRTPPASLL